MNRNPPTGAGSRSLFQRLDRWLWIQEHKRLERFLSGAADCFDLEQRLRHIDRGGASWFV